MSMMKGRTALGMPNVLPCTYLLASRPTEEETELFEHPAFFVKLPAAKDFRRVSFKWYVLAARSHSKFSVSRKHREPR